MGILLADRRSIGSNPRLGTRETVGGNPHESWSKQWFSANFPIDQVRDRIRQMFLSCQVEPDQIVHFAETRGRVNLYQLWMDTSLSVRLLILSVTKSVGLSYE